MPEEEIVLLDTDDDWTIVMPLPVLEGKSEDSTTV